MSVDRTLLEQIETLQLIKMFDLLPDTLFWIKNEKHQFIYANKAFVEHQRVKSIEQVIGKTDYHFAPAHIAKQFIRDDEKILAGERVTERLEMNMNVGGHIAWYSTTKRPLYNNQGKIIGSYGITRHLEKQAMALTGLEAVKVPVDYIKEHFEQPLTIETLAQVAHLSVSALERRFKKYLKKTPKQFINDLRLEQARRLLVETTTPIAEVAEKAGFSDHSYFSKKFKELFGELPSQFRDNYQ
ncbi:MULTISPECIES: helix-turn-helix transcriptional regulator [Thalassotalea]|uniref:helix-turn-helix transcriptional regulator n=1 Tax=Thalassotalea TaxID=1518149 RepID=UPI0009432665|nr:MULTISPECIES: AraC family transcriptional regulator [Thalassotalea]OKY26146.1 AraC family transcriptional regulator [Thalassotalea sp. PP2-459]